MDKETDALLKIARERENKKDLLAYQKSAERIRVRLARPQSNAAY